MTFHQKLKSVIMFIKDWNRNTNGDCFKKVEALEKFLQNYDALTNVDVLAKRKVELDL